MMARKIIVEIICFLFIILFVYAAVSKLTDLEKFKVQIGQSPMLTHIAAPLAFLVPGIEIIIAIGLAIPKTRIFALYASFGLMVMFTAYIIAIMNFSEYVPCSCGGVLSQMSWKAHLVFNILFIAIGAIGVVAASKVQQLKQVRSEV